MAINLVIIVEFLTVSLIVWTTCNRYLKRAKVGLHVWVVIFLFLIFIGYDLRHLANLWLPAELDEDLAVVIALGTTPLTGLILFNTKAAWHQIDFFIKAQKNYLSLKSFTDAAPCGLVELVHEGTDFRFTRSNKIASEIISKISAVTDPVGLLMCESIPGHLEPIAREGGLSSYEIYRRVAYKLSPYESGRRDAILEFDSPSTEGLSYYQQTVLRMDHGVITIGFTDVTEKINLISNLKTQIITDELTGLYTRAYMFQALDDAIARYRRGEEFCYLRIDLDNFSEINNTYGHSAGDEAIIWAANQIQSCVRESEVVSRMGGDEFAALIHGDLATGKRVGERIRASLSKPFEAGGATQKTTASIGVTEIAD